MRTLLRLVRIVSMLVVITLVAGTLWATRFFTSVPQTFVGSGPSMEPTLLPGEYFTVRPLDDPPRRGMLVVFRFVHDDSLYRVLRRVAALPGDSIAMRAGQAIVNGATMPWPFRILEPRASRSELAIGGELYNWGPVAVPDSTVFLLSDTRDIVGWPDSRFIGPVPLPLIEGRAERYLWTRRAGRLFRRLDRGDIISP